MGVIAKRPIANAAWRTGSKPEDAYSQPYWERLEKLKYPFLDQPVSESVATAMRFTASIPGVSTMIVGTQKPGRWSENAAMVNRGPLPADEFEAIRAQWREVAEKDWTGET